MKHDAEQHILTFKSTFWLETHKGTATNVDTK